MKIRVRVPIVMGPLHLLRSYLLNLSVLLLSGIMSGCLQMNECCYMLGFGVSI